MSDQLGRPDQEPPGLRRIRAVLEWSGEHDLRAGCELWATLSKQASRDDEIASVLISAPDGQQRASMLLSAVHDVVLSGASHPLRDYFPDLVSPARPIDGRLATTFADFVCTFGKELRHLVSSRTVQTNEVGRAVGVRLAVGALTDMVGAASVSVIEIGAAAGLLLAFDRYEYRIGDSLISPLALSSAACTLTCRLDDGAVDTRWLNSSVRVTRRVGLDLQPLDIENPDHRRWLHACIWPSQLERHERLDAAMAVARQTDIELVVADAARAVEYIAATDEGVLPIVISSWTLAYLTGDRQAAFIEALGDIGSKRPVGLVGIEGPGIVPGIAPPQADQSSALTLLLSASLFDPHGRTDRVLGTMGGHGDWLRL